MARKVALVVGNTDYSDPGLSRLRTPSNDVVNLARVLEHPEAGGFDEVKTLINPSSSDARKEIARLFAQRSHDDLVVLYFSGHGVLDEHGELHLAVRDTEREMVGATGVPARFVSEQMDRSSSKRAVLVLDCCHSGAFARGSKGAVGGSVGTKTAFEGNGQGRVVLTATDATQYAFEGDQVMGEGTSSIFTKHLLAGISTGEADTDGDGFITIDELYEYVQSKVLAESPRQSPLKWTMGQKGAMVISKNPSPRPADLPADIQEMMRATQTSAREAAIRDLTKLLQVADRRVVLAAKLALEKMQEDDSRRVSDAAKAALASVKIEAAKPIVEVRQNVAGAVHAGGGGQTGYGAPPVQQQQQTGQWQGGPQAGGWSGPPTGPAVGGQGQQAWQAGTGGNMGPQQGPLTGQWQGQQGGQFQSPASAPVDKGLLVVCAIFVPPVAFYLKDKKTTSQFWWSIGLMVFSIPTAGLTYLAGMIHALIYVLKEPALPLPPQWPGQQPPQSPYPPNPPHSPQPPRQY